MEPFHPLTDAAMQASLATLLASRQHLQHMPHQGAFMQHAAQAAFPLPLSHAAANATAAANPAALAAAAAAAAAATAAATAVLQGGPAHAQPLASAAAPLKSPGKKRPAEKDAKPPTGKRVAPAMGQHPPNNSKGHPHAQPLAQGATPQAAAPAQPALRNLREVLSIYQQVRCAAHTTTQSWRFPGRWVALYAACLPA